MAMYYKELLDGDSSATRRSNFARVCCDNICNILAMASSLKGMSQRQLASRLKVTRNQIRAAAERLELHRKNNMKQALVRFRRGVRSDKLKPEWEEFARKYWLSEDVSRPSEISKRSVRNPNDHSDETRYRLYYLFVPVAKEHQLMVAAAKARAEWDPIFNDFHLSATRNSMLRPFNVKDACRESCLCIYHLKWMQATEDLYNFRKKMRASGICKCSSPLLKQSADLWHTLLCEKLGGSITYQRPCATNQCDQCKDAKRLRGSVLCGCVKDTDRIKWMRYEEIDTGKTRVSREDGTISKVLRHDFVRQGTEEDTETTTLGAFLEHFVSKLWPEFVQHHDLAIWQDYDWQMQRANQPRYTVVTVEDFPENFTHLFKREPQSTYWQQVQSGMYVLVASFHLDDCANISEAEKEELRHIFDENNLPHIITESHIAISPDTQHGFAMVQHFSEKFFTPYVKQNMPAVTRRFARSDGCRAQYKGRHHFGFISSHGIEEELPTTWSWFCSCHGKCLCDPEGGSCKNAAQFYETRSENGSHLLSSWDFYAFCEANMKDTSKSMKQKKGRGIYRRFFYYVPATGEGSVNYAITRWCGIKGSNSVHQMKGGYTSGLVKCRGRSCHCVHCYSDEAQDVDAGGCPNVDWMPDELQWHEKEQAVQAAGRRPGLRGDREKLGHEISMTSNVGDYLAVLINSDEGWMIGLVLPPDEGAKLWGQDNVVLAEANGHPGMLDGQKSKAVQVLQVEGVSEAVNWMGELIEGDDVVFVQKLEPKATRGAGRSEWVLTNKKFACFTGDVRHAGFQMEARSAGGGRRSNRGGGHTSSLANDVQVTYWLPLNDKEVILERLATSR